MYSGATSERIERANAINSASAKHLPLLLGDKRRLQQVLINLIKNSLKFTHEGFIYIKAGYSQNQRRLNVKICDTGVGIEPEDIDKLFKAFGKLNNTN